MISADALSETPYLLDGERAAPLLAAATDLGERVTLLRRRGSVDDSTLAALRKEWNVDQVYESAGIEGNTLTLTETRLAISRGITISGKPPEHVDEVQRLHNAHEYLEQLLDEQGPITQRQLLDVHTLILGRGVAGAGEYRTVEVAIGNQPHKPPHPLKVPDMMAEYFKWLGAAANHCPVPLQASVAHAWLVHIHPFRDGNGRTARAVMNLLLMRAGFPIVIIRRKDRQRYYDALARSDEGDIGPLLELFLLRASDSLHQIDRVRKAASGVSIEVERIAAAEERAVSLWNAAVNLLCEEVAAAFERVVEADPAYTFSWKRYDELEPTDYRLLCQGEAVSQSWVARFELSRGTKAFRFLIWAGFLSDGMKSTVRGRPALFFSEQNPDRYPQWRQPSEHFATSLREIAYYDGRFIVRREGAIPKTETSTTVLALHLVQEVLKNAFD